MKVKICEGCNMPKPLWQGKTKTKPGLCKSCAGKTKSLITPELSDLINKSQLDLLRVKSQIKKVSDKPLEEFKQMAQVVFNKWIKKRDTDEFGMARCISCGGRDFAIHMDAGHYLSIGNNSGVRYNEHNVNLQCVTCNRVLHGNKPDYRIGLIIKIGEENVLKLESMAKIPSNLSKNDCLEIIKKYKI